MCNQVVRSRCGAELVLLEYNPGTEPIPEGKRIGLLFVWGKAMYPGVEGIKAVAKANKGAVVPPPPPQWLEAREAALAVCPHLGNTDADPPPADRSGAPEGDKDTGCGASCISSNVDTDDKSGLDDGEGGAFTVG